VIAGRQVVRAIGSSPEEPFSLIYATLLSAIASAETSVQITNGLLRARSATAGRAGGGRRARRRREADPARQTDSWLVFHAGRGYYARLLRAGVKIHERRKA
jgi:cardiolipin synthase